MSFSHITVELNHVIFNTTGFYVTSSNDINITLLYLHGNISGGDVDDKVLEFDADTTAGNVWFNISGFPANEKYIIKRNGVNITTPSSNSSGFISFNNSVWSNQIFEILQSASAPPTISNPSPVNGSTNQITTPVLNVTVDDPDDDTLNASWYSNSSGQWVLFATNSSIDTASGAVNISQTNSNFSNYSTTYYWSVNCTDGFNWTNETYQFTTLDFLWLDVTNVTWDISVVSIGSSIWTNATGKTFICEMDNTSVNTDLTLQITTDGATWHDASTPWIDEYRFNASIDNWANEFLLSEGSVATISSDIPAYQNETFDLRFDTPTATSTGVQQTITITAIIVKH